MLASSKCDSNSFGASFVVLCALLTFSILLQLLFVETKNRILDSNIDESATAVNVENLQKKKKKSSTHCCSIQ